MNNWGWGLVALASVAAPWQAEAQVRRINASAQIAAAVYAASATVEAVERRAEARDRERRTEINRLQTRLTTARTTGAAAVAEAERLEAELAAAQQQFVADLAERDRGYAQEIAVFRGAVESIAATSEGADALAKFNDGDRVGAIAILDRLRTARDEARQTRVDMESAAEAREIAVLAYDARGAGDPAFDTAAVITRFEEVTRLDPGEQSDWITLGELYASAGRWANAETAAWRGLELADDAIERANALRALGTATQGLGDLVVAENSFREAMQEIALLEAEDPDASDLARRRASIQLQLGLVLSARGDADGAISAYEAATDTMFDLAIENPSTSLQQELTVALVRTADANLAQGLPTSALTPLRGALVIYRRLTAAEPNSVYNQRGLAITLTKLGDTFALLDDLAEARAAFEEAQGVFETAAAADPTSIRNQIDLIGVRDRLGGVLIQQGDMDGARSLFEGNLATIEAASTTAEPSPDLDSARAGARFRLGNLASRLGQTAVARTHLETALAAYTTLAGADADPAGARQMQVAATIAELGPVLIAGGNAAEALELYDRQSTDLRARMTGPGEPATVALLLAASQRGAGDALVAGGNADEALERYEESLATLSDLPTSVNVMTHKASETILTLRKLGDLKRAQGDLPGARAALEEGVALLRSLNEGISASGSTNMELSLTLGDLSRIAFAQQDQAAAERLAREALDAALARADPAVPVTQLTVMGAYVALRDVTGDKEYLRPALAIARALQDSGLNLQVLPGIILELEQALAE